MSTLLETITAMLAKAGIAEDSPEAKEVITAYADLGSRPGHELLTKSLDTLMSASGAKANPEVRKFYISDLLTPLDKELIKQAGELLSPEDLAAFKAETSTYRKASMVTEAQIRAINEAKKAAAKSGDTDALKTLNEQLAEANRKVQETEQHWQRQLEAERNERESFIFNHELDRTLSNYKLAGVLADDPDRFDFLKGKLNKALKEAGAIAKRTDKGIELFQAESPTTPYYDKTKNTAVSFKDFSEKVVSPYVATTVEQPAPTEAKTYTGKPIENGQKPKKTYAEMQAEIR